MHVHLIFEKKDYYFGSISAIYSVLSAEQIGVKYNTLRNAKWRDISVYQTQRAIIKQGKLIRSSCKRKEHISWHGSTGVRSCQRDKRGGSSHRDTPP